MRTPASQLAVEPLPTYQVRRDALVQTKAILGIDEDFFLAAENCIPRLAIDCLY